MSFIKAGFDDKPLHINVSTYDGSININIEQEGLNTGAEKVIQRYETLSYATLEELIALRDEINNVLKQVVGV